MLHYTPQFNRCVIITENGISVGIWVESACWNVHWNTPRIIVNSKRIIHRISAVFGSNALVKCTASFMFEWGMPVVTSFFWQNFYVATTSINFCDVTSAVYGAFFIWQRAPTTVAKQKRAAAATFTLEY